MSELEKGLQSLKIGNKDLPDEAEVKRRAFRVSMVTELADFYKWTVAFKQNIPECDVSKVLSMAYSNSESDKFDESVNQVLNWFFDATVTKDLRVNCDSKKIVRRISQLCSLLQILTSDEYIKAAADNLKFTRDNKKSRIAELDRIRLSVMICACKIPEYELCEIILKNNVELAVIEKDWRNRPQKDQRLMDLLKLIKKVDFNSVESNIQNTDLREDLEEETENFSSFCACSEHMGSSISGDHQHIHEHTEKHSTKHRH